MDTNTIRIFSFCGGGTKGYGSNRFMQKKIMKGRDHLMNALEFAMLDGLPLARTKRQVEMRYHYDDRVRKF